MGMIAFQSRCRCHVMVGCGQRFRLELLTAFGVLLLQELYSSDYPPWDLEQQPILIDPAGYIISPLGVHHLDFQHALENLPTRGEVAEIAFWAMSLGLLPWILGCYACCMLVLTSPIGGLIIRGPASARGIGRGARTGAWYWAAGFVSWVRSHPPASQ